MLEYPNFEKTVLYSTDNLFSAFWYEYETIQKFYETSYNAATEEGWFANALKEAAKEGLTPEEVTNQINEHLLLMKNMEV